MMASEGQCRVSDLLQPLQRARTHTHTHLPELAERSTPIAVKRLLVGVQLHSDRERLGSISVPPVLEGLVALLLQGAPAV